MELRKWRFLHQRDTAILDGRLVDRCESGIAGGDPASAEEVSLSAQLIPGFVDILKATELVIAACGAGEGFRRDAVDAFEDA